MTDTTTEAGSLSLTAAARTFFKFPTPRILAPLAVGAVALRLALGHFRWVDLVIPVVILGLEPFTEWTIHVFLLHFKPRTFRGHRIDPLVAREHRAHHRDPRDLPLVFIPLPVLIISVLVGAAAYLLAFPGLRQGVTALAVSYSMLFAYEWTHYLIHTSYRPRRRFYRYVWRAHRLHHFKNEHYWFGVTVHLADHVLRTFPAKESVETSPTARTLGVEQAA
jgi:hypothetical protein